MMIDVNDRKPVELARRENLRRKKPFVYAKIMKYDDIVRAGGSVAIVDICYDYICNMNCSHCCNMRFAEKERKLTVADLRDFSEQADALGLAQVNISGGEPLLFRDLDEIVRAIDPSRFHISISTNGLFLDERKAIHLINIGVDKVKISLDSLNETVYLQTRRQDGAYEKAKESLHIAKSAGLQVSVQTVISHQTARTKATEQLAEFCQMNGFNFDIMIAKAIGRWEGKEEVLIDHEDAAHLVELRNRYSLVQRDVFPSYGESSGGCVAVLKTLHLTKYGDILPCGFIHISIGNIFQEPLKDIINRGFSIKYFHKRHPICLSGEDRNFIRRYMSKFYGKPLPIHWTEAFSDEDLVK
ncbi:MAG: radical SAM protein [Desulfobacteraceae bacterium]|nr:MAG: radical SAM protein [Desulfobacteraceae bacterium]